MNAVLLVLVLASQVLFSFADPAIDESSGLVDFGSLMVTTNDSGDDAVLYVVDPSTGKTVGRTAYAKAVLDVEALAPAGGGDVWAADIGDNRRARTSVTVYRVPVGRGEKHVDAPSYRLVYPDGAHDAESLVADDGRLYVITKEVFGGPVFVAPENLDPAKDNVLRQVGEVRTFATDAALFGDRRHVLVRNYQSAEIYTFPEFERLTSVQLPDQYQGEGISIGPGDRIRVSSEGAHSEVIEVGLPAEVRAALVADAATPSTTTEPTSTATPSAAPSSEAGAGTAQDEVGSTTSSSPDSALTRAPVAAGALVLVVGVAVWLIRRSRR